MGLDRVADPPAWWRDVFHRWVRRKLYMESVPLVAYAQRVAATQYVELPPRGNDKAKVQDKEGTPTDQQRRTKKAKIQDKEGIPPDQQRWT